MSNLSVFKSVDGIELVINVQTGEAFATQAGYSRMSGRDKSTISRRCTALADATVKSAKLQTKKGVQNVVLIPAHLVYRWLVRDNPELAIKMGEAGATVYLHQLAGFKIGSTATAFKTPQNYLEALEALVASEKEKLLLQTEQEQLKQDNKRLAQAIDELFDYSSIVRVANFNKFPETSFDWRKLKAASQVLSLEIKKLPCPRVGERNLYSHTVWRYAYPRVKLP